MIEPYGVVIYQSSIYVIATEEARDGEGVDRLKHWKLDRFRSATAMDAWYKPNDNIDVERTLAKRLASFPAPSRPTMRSAYRLAPRVGYRKILARAANIYC